MSCGIARDRLIPKSMNGKDHNASPLAHSAPGVPVIPAVNWPGLSTLYVKEVRRFFKVQLQTLWAPALNTLLFLVIFTVAMGRGDRLVLGVPFNDFIAPGLIVMGMMQNSFANSSSSILQGKLMGTIIDVLMPPLSAGELLLAYVAGAVTRAAAIGVIIWGAMLLWPGVHVGVQHLWAVLCFGLMGAVMLALLGVVTGLWAEKFDHAAAVTFFIVQPLSLLSGTFYALDALAPPFPAISHANPFFLVIDGFRFGFIGVADGPVIAGGIALLLLNAALWVFCLIWLRRGWRIKP